MKLSSWILRVSLIAMVILSLVFTSLIWRNPSRLERRSTSNVQVTTENDPNVKKMEGNVYLPNQFITRIVVKSSCYLKPMPISAMKFNKQWRIGI